MSKFLSKLSIITLILTLAVVFVGCGGGGGGGDDSSKIEGYWYIEKTEFEGHEAEYPLESEEEYGTLCEEWIIGLVKNEKYDYTKETAYDFSGEKITERITYEPESVAQYSIKGNKVSYKSSVETGTMTFAITGDSATIVDVCDGETYTLSARRVKASAVEGAKPEGSDDPNDINVVGYWRIISHTKIGGEGLETNTYPVEFIFADQDEGIDGKCIKEFFLGLLNNGSIRHYEKYTFVGTDPSQTEDIKEEFNGLEEGVYYKQITENYSIDGNTVSYTVMKDNLVNVEMEFELSGGDTEIIITYDYGEVETMIASEKVDESCVAGAVEREDEED